MFERVFSFLPLKHLSLAAKMEKDSIQEWTEKGE